MQRYPFDSGVCGNVKYFVGVSLTGRQYHKIPEVNVKEFVCQVICFMAKSPVLIAT